VSASFIDVRSSVLPLCYLYPICFPLTNSQARRVLERDVLNNQITVPASCFSIMSQAVNIVEIRQKKNTVVVELDHYET